MYDKAYDQSDSADLESEGRVMSNVINMGGSGANVQSKTVKSTATQQTITPPAGVDGFNPVIVQAVEPGAKVIYAEAVTPTSTTQMVVPNTEGLTRIKAIILLSNGSVGDGVISICDARDDSGNILMESMVATDSQSTGYTVFYSRDTSSRYLVPTITSNSITLTRDTSTITALFAIISYRVMIIGY